MEEGSSDGRMTWLLFLRIKRTVGLEIHIGWNRVVRRIFEALNYDVVKLDRSVYAGLDKKDLGRGEWRFLNEGRIGATKTL